MLILSLSLCGNILLEPCLITGCICDKCVIKAEETGHISRKFSFQSLLQKSGQEITQCINLLSELS